jgi:hypothetical protein
MAIPGITQLIDAIFTALNGDATLVARLASYGGGNAIFSGKLVPADSSLPFVIIRPISSIEPFGAKDFTGLSIGIDIGCYTGEPESTKLLEQIVHDVIRLLHEQELTLSSDTNFIAQLVGLTSAETDDEIVGSILSFNFTLI